MSEEVPAQWWPYFEAANFESFRDVATAAGVSPTTVIACLKPSDRDPQPTTFDKVASALRIPANKLRELRGDPKAQPFTVPVGADKLGAPERRVITEVIRAFAQHHERESKSAAREAAFLKQLSLSIATSLREQAVLFQWLDERIADSDRAEYEHLGEATAQPLLDLLSLLTSHHEALVADGQELSAATAAVVQASEEARRSLLKQQEEKEHAVEDAEKSDAPTPDVQDQEGIVPPDPLVDNSQSGRTGLTRLQSKGKKLRVKRADEGGQEGS